MMVVSRVLRATGCASCRLSLLRAFTSVTGSPIRLQAISAKLPRTRWYSSQISQEDGHEHVETRRGVEGREELSGDVVEETIDEGEHSEMASTQASSLPWYLQVETATKEPQPLSERQRIPDLPESPPYILKPLLRQISIDLGLDDLSLLDLRKLDPPPALGANLLMLIGTARSEKHLHVSADRLCRWLRSTYKLRPDADGLLGRNELKLKLRRKSRRAKMMGSAADDTGDDGVRTGWVCVDVGVVEAPESTVEEMSTPQNFVGFGRRTDGVRIVVQMLTEEKRAEIDLEKLWGGILKRGGQPEIEGSEDEGIESVQLPEPTRQIESHFSPILSQSRGFHTSARSYSPEMETESSTSQPTSFASYLPPATTVPRYDISDLQSLATSFLKSDTDMIRETLEANGVSGEYNGEWRAFLLDELKSWLESKPLNEAMEALGRDFADHSSTQFLTCFYQVLSDFPSQAEGEAKIWLQSYAKCLGHLGYTKNGILDTFHELQLSGIRISRDSFLDLLRQVLRPDNDIDHEYHSPQPYTVNETMDIIQAMFDQGHDILKEDILVELQEAVASLGAVDFEPNTIVKHPQHTFDIPSFQMTSIQRRIHVLIRTIDLPCFSDESRIRLLELYSRHHHWQEFWEIWNMAPLRRQPQSAAMYACMFNAVASTMHQQACTAVLRTWISDLDREIPEVKLEGDVAEAVKACLKVADPFIEEDVLDPEAKGEWIRLWRRCANEA